MCKSIDLETDQLLTLSDACRRLLIKPVSPATLWRWRTIGVLVNGTRIKLACVKVGRTWHTTKTAFADFLKRQTEAATADHSESGERSESTSRQLSKAGLL